LLGVGIETAVVVPRHAGDATEGGSVGQPRAAKDVEDRKRDRDGDAGEHAEQRDTEEGCHRQQELDAALLPQPANTGDVRQ
jgi:hypothetical protein